MVSCICKKHSWVAEKSNYATRREYKTTSYAKRLVISLQVSAMTDRCQLWPASVTCDWQVLPLTGKCHLTLASVAYDWQVSHITGKCLNSNFQFMLVKGLWLCLWELCHSVINTTHVKPWITKRTGSLQTPDFLCLTVASCYQAPSMFVVVLVCRCYNCM